MGSHKKELLSTIQTLTFYDGEQTTYRRGSPVDQLVCQGAGCKHFRPDLIQCYNRGGHGADINWKCEADLPAKLKLARVQVGCEGWSHSGDPYVLKGSCGLTYTLKIDSTSFHDTKSSETTNLTWLFWILFLGLTVVILYPVLRGLAVKMEPGSGGGGGGGGGDVPPPYTPGPAPKPRGRRGSEGWAPGFWTGLASGLATHLLTPRERRPAHDAHCPASDHPPRCQGSSRDHHASRRHGGSPDHTPSRRQGSSRDLDDQNMGPIQTSTGFGGTRNR